MIGSVTEFQREQAGMLARREAIAAQQAAASAPPVPRQATAPVPAGIPAAGGLPAAAAPVTLTKAGEPGIAKDYADRGATASDGEILMPGHLDPQDFRRPYESAGHGAESPGAGPPRSFPVADDHPEAEDFTRGYEAEGHASPGLEVRESPPAGDGQRPGPQVPPGVSGPVPHAARSFPQVELSPFALAAGIRGPLTDALAAHQARVSTATPIPDGDPR